MKIFANKMKEIMNTFCNSNYYFETACISSDDNGYTIEANDYENVIFTKIYVHKSAFGEYRPLLKPITISIHGFYNIIRGIPDYTMVNLHIPEYTDGSTGYIHINYSCKFANVSKLFTCAINKTIKTIDCSLMYNNCNYISTKIPVSSFKFIASEIGCSKPMNITKRQDDNVCVKIHTYEDKITFYYKDSGYNKCNISHPAMITNHYVSTILDTNEHSVNFMYYFFIQYKKLLKYASGDVSLILCNGKPLTLNYKICDNTIGISTIFCPLSN